MGRRYRGEDFDWSEDSKKIAAELFSAGTPSGDIANELGCSRNAVIGKMRRMGVVSPNPRGRPQPPEVGNDRPRNLRPAPRPPKARPNMQTINARAARMQVSGPPALPVERFHAKEYVAPKATRKRLQALRERDCRWPCWQEPSDIQWFCGAPQADGVPYCMDHCRVAYTGHRPVPGHG